MWMTTLKRRHDRLDQVEVALQLDDADNLESFYDLVGAKVEIKRVRQTSSESCPCRVCHGTGAVPLDLMESNLLPFFGPPSEEPK